MAGALAILRPHLPSRLSWASLWHTAQYALQERLLVFGRPPGPGDRPPFRQDELPIVPQDGHTVILRVEIAETPREQQYGLMFRQTLPRDQGMLFLFSPPRKIGLWMKDTPVPLDFIFVGADGRILSVAENQEPFSLRRVDSPGPVRAVLEINAGEANNLGIARGALLRHPAFIR